MILPGQTIAPVSPPWVASSTDRGNAARLAKGQKANYTVGSAGISGLGSVCAVALSHLSTWLTVIARNCCCANYWMDSSATS